MLKNRNEYAELKDPIQNRRITAGEMAASPQQFCLRWNNHQSNIISVFEQLLQSEAFVDVTLAVDGMSLKAHKVVLSACSPYFQAILASHPDKHPIVILKDVRYGDMRDLLDFMYRGEVSVDQENLSGFLKVAESLRIKGLTEVNEKKRMETSAAPYFMQHCSSLGVGTPTIPISAMGNVPTALKRPSPSPIIQYSVNKRRRGRPPKISGEESEGEANHLGSAENSTISAGDSEEYTKADSDFKSIKIEAEEFRENHSDESKDNEARATESAGPSGEIIVKDEPKSQKEDCDTRESPGSGGGIPAHMEWTPSGFDPEDNGTHSPGGMLLHRNSLAPGIINLHSKHHPPPAPPPPPMGPIVSDIDQLYYTKNLLEAAMRKSPYELLKNDKAFHGSILLETLRAPMKFGFHSVYGGRDSERELLDHHAPLSPHTSSSNHNHLKSNSHHTSPTPRFPTPATNNVSLNNNNTNTNHSKGASVPIMSYCIQDNGFKCSKCFQTFTHPSNFHRHYITVHTDRRAHKCHVCGKEFKRKDNMMSHIRSVHRPGKETHTLFKDLASSASPTISRNASPLPEQLLHMDKV